MLVRITNVRHPASQRGGCWEPDGVDIACSIPHSGKGSAIRIGTWIKLPDRSLFRFSNIPAGMTIAEAERIVSRPGWKPSGRSRTWNSEDGPGEAESQPTLNRQRTLSRIISPATRRQV